MQINVTNLLSTPLSLELVFEAGPGPHGRVIRERLTPGESVDISAVATLAEANMNATLRSLMAAGIVSVEVLEESSDILSTESQFNKLRNDVVTALLAAVEAAATEATVPYHKANPAEVTPEANADGTDLATTITLANSLKAKINLHLQSEGDTGAHLVASAVLATSADATDQATLETLLNELKVVLNDHLTEAGVHIVDDGTNDVTSADATNLATAETLANEIKDDYNAHIDADNALDSLPMGSN